MNARGERVERTRSARTAHVVLKKCGECLGEVAVCVLILFIVFIESKKLEIRVLTR